MIAIPRNWLIGIVGSLLVHVMCARAAIHGETTPPQPPAPIEVALVEKAPPPEAPPPPPKPTQVAHSFQRTAARAGRVLDAAPSPVDDSPVDFSIVEGASDAYVGGTTSARGTGDAPVHGPVTPRAVATTTPSLAKLASPAGGEWDCSALYPGDGTVMIRAHVDAEGSPTSVEILRDPSPAFADAARRCAMSQRYKPALDALGTPAPGSTAPFVIRFHL